MQPVSELLGTKIHLLSVQIQNIELQLQHLQQQGRSLVTQRDGLLAEARAEVRAPEGHAYNIETRLFVPHETPAPLSTPATR